MCKGYGESIVASQIAQERARSAAIAAKYPPARYQHDCTACTYLGQHEEYDLYFCSQSSKLWPTVIARWSSDGPDYKSGLEFAKLGILPEMTVAYRRAVENGLLAE